MPKLSQSDRRWLWAVGVLSCMTIAVVVYFKPHPRQKPILKPPATATKATKEVPVRPAQPRAEAPKPRPTFSADVKAYRLGLIVSNSGTNTWAVINIYVNSNPPRGYGCRIENVKPLESRAIPLSEFIDRSGKRFNPYEYKVVRVVIGGGGFDYVEYGF